MTTTNAILLKADTFVGVERETSHGNKRKNHKNIASMWSAYLGISINEVDVALMMALLKIARTKEGEYNSDDYIDLCGYGAIAGELAHKLNRGKDDG